jgi:hypothetical protein
MSLCSPVSVSLFLHLLVLSDLLLFSTSAPQPSFTVSVMNLCSFLLLHFMLCVPCPFYAPFLFCAFKLLHSISFSTPESFSTASNLLSILPLYPYVPLVHILSTILLHALPMLSVIPDHHSNSSASLVVKPMRPSSLGVMPRFLSLSSNRDSSSSLSQLSSFPLLQFQAPTILHLSIASMSSPHSTGRCLETLHILWRSP